MKEKIYDNKSYKTIKELIESGNSSKAMSLIKKILEENPLDKWTRLEYTRLLKRDNRLTEALDQVLFILSIIDINVKDNFYKFVILELYYINLKLGNYQTAYDYFPQVKEINEQLENSDMEVIKLDELFLKSRLGLLEEDESFAYKHGYLASQIVHYSENRALEHILKHKEANYNKENHSILEDEIYIKGLFDRIKKLVEDAIPLYADNFANVYYFEYPNISYVILKEGYPYKYLKVVVFSDTKQIITIHPIFSKERIEIVNSLKTAEKPKVKQMSQIEKFNNRYNKK